jgi:hypothetical protein
MNITEEIITNIDIVVHCIRKRCKDVVISNYTRGGYHQWLQINAMNIITNIYADVFKSYFNRKISENEARYIGKNLYFAIKSFNGNIQHLKCFIDSFIYEQFNTITDDFPDLSLWCTESTVCDNKVDGTVNTCSTL